MNNKRSKFLFPVLNSLNYDALLFTSSSLTKAGKCVLYNRTSEYNSVIMSPLIVCIPCFILQQVFVATHKPEFSLSASVFKAQKVNFLSEYVGLSFLVGLINQKTQGEKIHF